jgi:hypothetical protein
MSFPTMIVVQRRLCDAQLLRGTRDAAGICDLDEVTNAAQIHVCVSGCGETDGQ